MGPLTALDTIAPPIAGALAWRLFWDLGTPAAVHPRDAAVHDRARRSELTYGDRTIPVYEWGSGPAVLLVHGWRSRASRFSALVEALENEHTVVAFDAPGNGDSPGRRTTAFEYAAIAGMLSERYDGFDTIVGHSLGVVATVMAVRDFGARTQRIVGIAGVHDFDHVLDVFARKTGLTASGARRFRDRFTAWAEPVMGDPFRRLVSELPGEDQVPMLLVHDRSDREVEAHQADLIAVAHADARVVLTDGLGHNRILSDPAVVDAVREFVTHRTRSMLAA